MIRNALPWNIPSYRPGRRLLCYAGAFLVGIFLLIWLEQPIGLVLLLPIALLLIAIEQRDQRALMLAHRIASGRLTEKLEVQRGAWGELHRSVNGLLQERRIQQRICTALPMPLPQEAIQALLGGQLPDGRMTQVAAVLLISYTGRPPNNDEQACKTTLVAWQALAHAAQDEAQRHGALLQPCGDAILLAFGAFEEQHIGETLRAALDVADALQATWQQRGIGIGGPLVLSLSVGHALAMLLPGLGYCLFGMPVEQAVHLHHTVRQSPHAGLVCSEGVYYALRRTSNDHWQPTELRPASPNSPPLIVYYAVENQPHDPAISHKPTQRPIPAMQR